MEPMFWMEKTKDGEIMTDLYARLLKDRIIFLRGEIDSNAAAQIVAMLILLDNQDPTQDINLWLYSPGGDVSGFFAIYDTIQMIKADVSTVCFGTACSAAAMLLAAGTPGKRCCMPNARVMIHQIQAEVGWGNGTSIEVGAKEISEMKKRIIRVLACHTGQTEAKIKRDTEYDKFLDANASIDYGIVDKIMPLSKKIPELKTKRKSVQSKEIDAKKRSK
jgi:ATP-dependent Clp protease protease subunit